MGRQTLLLILTTSHKLSHAEMIACWVSRRPNLAAALCLHLDALSPFSLYLRLSKLALRWLFSILRRVQDYSSCPTSSQKSDALA